MRRMLLLSLFVMGCLLNSLLPARAQTGQAAAWVRVSGTVSDAGTKLLLPGVAVRIRRTRQGGVTTAQGNFLLTASPTDTLIFQAVGYQPYLLQLPGAFLSQLVVQVRLQRDTIRLREVRVTADRVDRTAVNRALRNLKRPALPPVKGPQRPPKPKPFFAVDSTPPPPPPPSGAEIGVIYDHFSRSGRERRKMQQVKAQAAQQKARQRVLEHSMKDNQGYE
jgi:hypothetical protein